MQRSCRPRAVVIVAQAVAAAVAILWSNAYAQALHQRGHGVGAVATGQPELAAGTPIRRALALGQTQTFRVRAEAGDFIQVTVEQQGVDIAATLVGPDGLEIVSVDAMDDEFRPEIVVAIVDKAGLYQVRVRPSVDARAGGHYTARLDALRPAVENDSMRVEAERAFAHGRQIRKASRATTWPDALADFNTALERYRRLSDRRGEAKALLEVGITEYFMTRPDAARTAQEAARIAQEVQDRPAAARALRSAGNSLVLNGDLVGAVRALEQSTAISHAIGHRNAECRSLNDTAIAYRRLGDVDKAIGLYERALPLARATSDTAMQVNIVNNLGVAYKSVGEYAQARTFYEQTLANRRAAKDTKGEYSALGNLGILYRHLGEYAKAQDFLQQELEITRRVTDREHEANALNELGATYADRGDYARALEYHREALGVRQQIGDVGGQALALVGMGRALHVLGNDDDALAALEDGLAIFRRIHDQFGERDALDELARVERDRGHLLDAAQRARESVGLDESLRARITSSDLRASFIAAEQDKYELLIDILQRQHQADPAAADASAALQVSERARARVLLDSVIDGHVDLRSGVEPRLLERERELQRALRDASERLSRLLVDHARDETPRDAARRLDDLTAAYQQLEADIRRQNPHYAALTQPQPLGAVDIQRSVLDAGTVLLEFELGEEKSWMWAVTAGSIQSAELPPRRQIESVAHDVYRQFAARLPRHGETNATYLKRVGAADASLARGTDALSRILLGPIAAQLNGEWSDKRLAFVPSGVLDYVPFAALPVPLATEDNPNTGVAGRRPRRRRVLLASHEIVQLPSASVLSALRQELTGRPRAPQVAAIFADPVYDRTDPRVVGRQPLDRSHPESAMADGWPTANSASGRTSLARLSFSRGEADGIAALSPRGTVFEAVDFNASRATVLNTALDAYRIVHFSTHGIFDAERPALSSLVLSLVGEDGSPRDGYLRMQDAYNMHLNADLVVLSACETALGKEIRGEGPVGMARAFMYAGAPRVVASLWQVDDDATAELMKRFYRGMLQEHLTAAAALTEAQRQIRGEARWRSPFFWAGFTLIGDWR